MKVNTILLLNTILYKQSSHLLYVVFVIVNYLKNLVHSFIQTNKIQNFQITIIQF